MVRKLDSLASVYSQTMKELGFEFESLLCPECALTLGR